MYILGISAFYHDSAACLVLDGEIIAAAQEERFSRQKHDSSFPSNSIKFCLDHAQISLEQVSVVSFYEKPLMKFERVLETFLAIAPKGGRAFIKYMPGWLKQKLFFRKYLNDQLKGLNYGGTKHLKVKFTDHHVSHAAWAYFTSPFEESAILTIDGVGEWTTTAIYHAQSSEIKLVQEQKFPNSLGLLYSSFTQFLGFRVNDGEYKMMGLAPYGNKHSERHKFYLDKISSELVKLYDDGSIELNQKYFSFLKGFRMIDTKKWSQLFDLEPGDGQSELTQAHCDFALAAQDFTEEAILRLAREAKGKTGSNRLCIAGGVGYNCTANGRLMTEKVFDSIFIPPAVGDSGSAIGSALLTYSLLNEQYVRKGREMKNKISFLGPEASTTEVENLMKSEGQEFLRFDDFEELCLETTKLLEQGAVVGWMQGRMEFGARALGARSILADPRHGDIQEVLNQKIKFRESFRPFASIVLEEDVNNYFEIDAPSPYMAIITDVRPEHRHERPSGYEDLAIREKLKWEKSKFSGVTHVDYSSRIQTVEGETNPKLWQLLCTFKEATGESLLINTSFNVKDQPIVCSAKEAYDCFMATNMDYLVIENILVAKSQNHE